MRVLFLDDAQDRIDAARTLFENEQLTVVSTAADAIEQLRDNKFDFVSLDHDLGGEVMVNSNREDCGMEVVRFMVSEHIDVGSAVNIHSWNAPASARMVQDLAAAGYFVTRRLFSGKGFV